MKKIPYYVDFYNCVDQQARDSFRLAMTLAGASVSDEKIFFNKNIVRFYFQINYIDEKQFDKFVENLKKSPVWKDCSWSEDQILKKRNV